MLKDGEFLKIRRGQWTLDFTLICGGLEASHSHSVQEIRQWGDQAWILESIVHTLRTRAEKSRFLQEFEQKTRKLTKRQIREYSKATGRAPKKIQIPEDGHLC